MHIFSSLNLTKSIYNIQLILFILVGFGITLYFIKLREMFIVTRDLK